LYSDRERRAARWLRHGMSEIASGLDPGSDRVLDIGDSLFGRSPVAHAARQIGCRRQKASPLLQRQRLDHDRIFESAHCCFLTASIKATSLRIYTGLIGRL